jgi:hypothetical protein
MPHHIIVLESLIVCCFRFDGGLLVICYYYALMCGFSSGRKNRGEMDFSYCRSDLVSLLISYIVRGGCSSIKTASSGVFLAAAMVVHRSLPHARGDA